MKLTILSYLSPRELVAMSLTSHQWNELASHNILWAEHCRRHLIPIPNRAEILGSYKERFAQVRNLTLAIKRHKIQPTMTRFDNPIYSVLVESDSAFLACREVVQIWDTKFTKIKKIPISGFCEYVTPDRLEIIGNVLFCFHFPNPDCHERRAILFSYDLVRNVQVKNGIPISLSEWEHGESKHRGGRLAFSEDKAFVNYKNGDIRVWDLRNEDEEYTDDIEYENYHNRFVDGDVNKPHISDPHGQKGDKEIVLSLMKRQEKLRKERKVLQGHTSQITHLSFVNDYLYSSSEDGTIKIWNIGTAQCIQTIITDLSRSTYGATVLGVDHFLVNGSHIFGYMYDKNENYTLCKLWDTHTGLCLQIIKLNTCMDSYCLYGKLLFFSYKTTIYIYDLSTGKEIRTLTCDIQNDDLYNPPMLTNLQISGSQLICCGKKRQWSDADNQIFIFDFSSMLCAPSALG